MSTASSRPLLAYAVAGSIAAAAIGYVFAPSVFPSDESTGSTSTSHRNGTISGLANPANDCFINSVLQALAGLPRLHEHLIRIAELDAGRAMRRRSSSSRSRRSTASSTGFETHASVSDNGNGSADAAIPVPEKPTTRAPGDSNRPWNKTIEGDDDGDSDLLVSMALLVMVTKLNQRSPYRKTISSRNFVKALEIAFQARISKRQQDAQEFLLRVLERLGEECNTKLVVATNSEVGQLLEHTFNQREQIPASRAETTETIDTGSAPIVSTHPKTKYASLIKKHEPSTFPFEGQLGSFIECQTCSYKPKPHTSNFLVLTLIVPQKDRSTLDECLDDLLKPEHIADYRCAYCTLQMALRHKQRELHVTTHGASRTSLSRDIQRLEAVIAADPENIPHDVSLPAQHLRPKTQISKHTRIAKFPQILSLHLSRSIFDPSNLSRKNYGRVNFPEVLYLGGFSRHTYMLMSVITHKGGHDSGHYETFRRHQHTSSRHRNKSELAEEPGSEENILYVSKPNDSSGQRYAEHNNDDPTEVSDVSTAQLRTDTPVNKYNHVFSKEGIEKDKDEKTIQQVKTHRDRPQQVGQDDPNMNIHDRRATTKISSKWWRTSDDAVSQCRTADVLSMQTGAYLLFYERIGAAD